MARTVRNKFGEECLACMTKDKDGKGFHRAYVELKGQMYSLTFSNRCKKENGSGYIIVKKAEKSNKSNW